MQFQIKTSELIGDIAKAITDEGLAFKFVNDRAPTNKDIIDVAILTLYNQVVTNGDFSNLLFSPTELEEVNNSNTKLEYNIHQYISKSAGRGY